MLIYYNAHHHHKEFHKNLSKSWETVILLLFRVKIVQKMAHIYLKNVPENLCIPLLSGNGTPLPCTKYFKSYEVVYTSCDQLTHGRIPPPPHPQTF